MTSRPTTEPKPVGTATGTTLLNVLSPELQALVEASLGGPLPVRPAHRPEPGAIATDTQCSATSATQRQSDGEEESQATDTEELTTNRRLVTQARRGAPELLNPGEVFALRGAEAPGFVVKPHFLGAEHALQVRDALLALSRSASFHAAGIGHGSNQRLESAVRGDRIHWIQRPSSLGTKIEGNSETKDENNTLAPAIGHLLRRVEKLAYGVKLAIPEFQLRNVTSTQLAVFPGDGSRFVRHTDTYPSREPKHHAHGSSEIEDEEELVRLLTCVYYLNEDWEPEHKGCLRVYLNDGTDTYWDVPPALDTLVVFRSSDVEHEVLPALHERLALTIWYYGPRSGSAPAHTSSQEAVALPSADGRNLLQRLPPSIAAFLAPATNDAKPAHQSLIAPVSTPQNVDGDATIFVAIPSYRDSECRHTVDDLLRKATHPTRITIGICLQSEDEESVVDSKEDPRRYLTATYPLSQVRVHWMHYRDASGPCVARAITQSLWQGETFYLQIDSHMRFREGWDSFLIDELEKCDSAKPILTTYPLGYTLPNEVPHDTRPTLLCATGFDEHGMLRQAGKTLTRTADSPIPSLFWAAGFAFSSAQVIKEVPYDPSLRSLFFGEEGSMNVRLWTHGWDFFAPTETIVYHLWTRAHRPVFQELETESTQQQRLASQKRITALLVGTGKEGTSGGSEEGNDPFGLGPTRSLAEYEKHIGVNFAHGEIEWRTEWGNADPIQFDLSSSSSAIPPTPALSEVGANEP